MQVQILSLRFLSNIKEEYSFLYRKRDDTSPCRLRTRLRASSRPSMNSIFFVKRIRIKLLFSEKFGILKITGGTPGLACAISAGKKMVLDQKPPLQREQVVGSSRILYIILNSQKIKSGCFYVHGTFSCKNT